MRFYPKRLLVTAAALTVLWLAVNVRAGLVGALALGVLSGFEFLYSIGFFRGYRSDSRR